MVTGKAGIHSQRTARMFPNIFNNEYGTLVMSDDRISSQSLRGLHTLKQESYSRLKDKHEVWGFVAYTSQNSVYAHSSMWVYGGGVIAPGVFQRQVFQLIQVMWEPQRGMDSFSFRLGPNCHKQSVHHKGNESK